MKFDIIGDIHGQFDTLVGLLAKLGYATEGGTWRHGERKALFLGDYIDRGPKPAQTLELVRAMVEAGHAYALMGNHELNAIAYHTLDASGQPLRPHTPNNKQQHARTLEAFEGHADEWAQWIAWFKGLPFFFEHPGFRAVHACWCERSLELVRGHTLLDREFLMRATDQGTSEWAALEMLLKGPELDIGRLGLEVHVKGDRPRKELRVRWWGYTEPTYLLSEISMPPGADLHAEPVDASELRGIPNLRVGGMPVFFGHYRLPHGRPVGPIAEGFCCLDYGAGSGGALVAYRWDGEAVVEPSKFVVQPEYCGGP